MRARSVLLVLAAALAPTAIAQKDDDTSSTSVASTSPAATTTSPTSAASTSASSTAKTSPSTALPKASTTTDAPEETSPLPDINQSSTTTTPSPTTILGQTTTNQGRPPAVTSSGNKPPPLPGSYSYPPAAVPPTEHAPFMQQSTLPQGTVFIAVGAILGAFAVAILIWRAVVACLLHRSVRRATLAQQVANDKSSYGPPSTPLYKYSDHASTLSLGTSPPGQGKRRTQRGPIPSSTPSQTNLFFSPTATSGAGNTSNRESRFLPSGFYAAGAGSPQQGDGQSISLTNLRPDSRGRGRAVDPSPPDSPNLPRPQVLGRRNPSSSTLNLNRPVSGRAPSAYLEDLLADQPEQFPPGNNRNSWNRPTSRN
ncbi:hypothetical protein F5Y17DRAFT_147702 [Xylariaceae sp. FL0594]|nr:hypothetical protein F5Y17DRAFT_147702 [Xylariaceae sp. FL0594]